MSYIKEGGLKAPIAELPLSYVSGRATGDSRNDSHHAWPAALCDQFEVDIYL
jgi:hypothetical protein